VDPTDDRNVAARSKPNKTVSTEETEPAVTSEVQTTGGRDKNRKRRGGGGPYPSETRNKNAGDNNRNNNYRRHRNFEKPLQRQQIWQPRQKHQKQVSNQTIHGHRFENKVICVTGVGKGIGHDLFLELLREGAYVIGISRSEEDFVKLEQQIQQLEREQLQSKKSEQPQNINDTNKEEKPEQKESGDVNEKPNGDDAEKNKKSEMEQSHEEIKIQNLPYRLICADLSVKSDLTKVIEDCVALKVDMLVNNAGVAKVGKFLEVSYEDLRYVHATNFDAVFLLSQGVAKYWVENDIRGNIVNISSSASLRVLDEHSSYCTSKCALDALTKCMALELGSYGIRVNSVHPAVVLTPMGISVWQNNPTRSKPFLERIPMHRFVEIQEVTKVVMFLLSDEASMINGALLPIDGGLSV